MKNEFAKLLLPDLLGVLDLSLRLHLSPSAIRTHLRTGRIPAAKLGRRWIVKREELLRALTPHSSSSRLYALPPIKEEGRNQ